MKQPEKLISNLIGDEIYSNIVDAVRDIYPLKKIEIRRSELISSGKEAYEFIEPTDEQKPPEVEPAQ